MWSSWLVELIVELAVELVVELELKRTRGRERRALIMNRRLKRAAVLGSPRAVFVVAVVVN